MVPSGKLSRLGEDPRLEALESLLCDLESVAVAYSGGVDSTFLLRCAQDVLGNRALGVLGVSDSLDRSERVRAEALASAQGLRIVCVETREMENPLYRQNDGERCFHCKDELFQRVRAVADREGLRWVLDGSHAGDRGDHRPGFRARDAHGVRSPLLEVGLDKEALREYSRRLGLPTWDKPAAPCLASRLPYGVAVSAERLRQVEAAEAVLRDLGFEICRVRHHDDVARIEVPLDRLAELLATPARERIVEGLRAAGYLHVALDLAGFRSGSLNEALERKPEALVSLEPTRRAASGEGLDEAGQGSESRTR